MTEKLIKASLIRALYTAFESLISNLPVGFVITPVMIQSFDWSFLYVVLAWIATALFAGFCAFIRAIVAGLPEVEDIYIEDDEDDEDFEDEEVNEDDDEH